MKNSFSNETSNKCKKSKTSDNDPEFKIKTLKSKVYKKSSKIASSLKSSVKKIKQKYSTKKTLNLKKQSKQSGSTRLEMDQSILAKFSSIQIKEAKSMLNSIYKRNQLETCITHKKTDHLVLLVHTLLANSYQTKINKVLVLTQENFKVQLNFNNWQKKFDKLTDASNYKLNIFHVPKGVIYKKDTDPNNQKRINLIEEWFEKGGVLLLDFGFFYWLLNVCVNGRYKYSNILMDEPGADLVVYDTDLKKILARSFPQITTKRQIILKNF